MTGFFSYNYGSSELERSYTSQLSGSDDSQFVNRLIDLATGAKPKGASIQTTLNAKAQKAAASALGDKKGAVVALNPKTGAILPAMGYGEKQTRELEETINKSDVDMVVIGTPIDLSRVIKINKAVDCPGEARADWVILQDLARAILRGARRLCEHGSDREPDHRQQLAAGGDRAAGHGHVGQWRSRHVEQFLGDLLVGDRDITRTTLSAREQPHPGEHHGPSSYHWEATAKRTIAPSLRRAIRMGSIRSDR